jgi:hypothetical protein
MEITMKTMKTMLAVCIYSLFFTSHTFAGDVNNSLIIREGDPRLDSNPKVCKLYTIRSSYVVTVESYSRPDGSFPDIYDSYKIEDNNHLDLINYTYEQALDYIDSGLCEGIYFHQPIKKCEISKIEGHNYKPDTYFVGTPYSKDGTTFFANLIERGFNHVAKIQSRLSEIGFCKKPVAKDKCLVRGTKGNYTVDWNNPTHDYTLGLKTLKDVKAEKLRLKNAGICY